MSDETVLVTGALGCIGAWVVRHLLDEGVDVVAADVGDADHRLRWLLSPDELGELRRVRLDITDDEAVASTVGDGGFTAIVHLAALQVPFCRADPVRGAQVNLTGTVSLIEAYRRAGSFTGPFVYASSIAAYDPDDSGDGPPTGRPRTLYGVYKLATEQAAAVYADDHGVASIGLRPHVVYGVGRDQGMTSSPTVAMLRVAAGQGATIGYSGASQLQYAPDVAAAFVAAARADVEGAHVFNLGGPSVDMTDVVAAIESAAPDVAGRVTITGDPLPFPPAASDGGLGAVVGALSHTPLDAGVASTIERFRSMLADGAIAIAEPS
jgi:nucleoside-diphosphate-sugar epimerase